MPMTLRRFSVHFTLAVALVLVGGAAACSDDDGEDGSPDPTTTQPTTTLTQAQEDEQALRQLAEDWYDARSEVFYEGADVAVAEAFATGRYLTQFETDIESFRASGQRLEPGDSSREVVESIEVDGDTADVTTCLVDADALFGADGELISDDVGTTRYESQASRTSEGWRFDSRQQVGETEEGDQCAEQ